jgi:hypothetical protein
LLLSSAALAVLAFTGAVEAAEVNTSLLRSNSDDAVNYRCHLTNLGTGAISVTFTIRNTIGTVVNTPTQVTVGAGSTGQSTVFGDDAAGAWCNVSGKFSKKKVAVNFQLLNASNNITHVVVPAQ